MPCFKPRHAWRGTRDRAIYWRAVPDSEPLTLACKQCIGCKLEYSRQWATRCMHESKMWRYNCFITLTYDDAYLPQPYSTGLRRKDGSVALAGNLNHRDVQLFLKKLRARANYRPRQKRNHTKAQLSSPFGEEPLILTENKSLGRGESTTAPQPILYYMSGEYGELYRRPHYHMCLFNCDFNDKLFYKTTPAGSILYQSETLTKLWGMGFAHIGELNWQSAAYTARYITQKWTGDPAKAHYTTVCAETGEIIELTPEYCEMSRSKGIGKTWLDKYHTDVYPHGYVILKNNKVLPPSYYDRKYKEKYQKQNFMYWKGENQDEYELMKERRVLAAALHSEDQTPHRLEVRAEVLSAKLQSLKRTFKG